MKILNLETNTSYLTLLSLNKGAIILTEDNRKALVLDTNLIKCSDNNPIFQYTYVTKDGCVGIAKFELLVKEHKVNPISDNRYVVKMIEGTL